jgi:predicted anti-sigma-YlaC factor YlaD
MTCHEVRQLLGVYVLGKADPDDRAVVEEHLTGCARCREELAELEGLPTLLALVPAVEAARTPVTRPGMPSGDATHDTSREPVQTSPDQLRRLLAAAAETRSRRRWVTLAAAAGLLVLVAGVGGLAVATRQQPAQAPPVAVATWVATDSGTGTHATVELAPRPSGTAIDLSLSGVPAGTRCSLVVTDVDGAATSAASWEADYAGTATVTGFTATPVGQIRHLAIVTSTGRTLATITPAAIPRSTPGQGT